MAWLAESSLFLSVIWSYPYVALVSILVALLSFLWITKNRHKVRELML